MEDREKQSAALDSLLALTTFLAVRVSGRPADSDHLYGHGKIESLSALFETVLLAATCAWIAGDAVAATGVSVVVGWVSWRLGRRTVDALIDSAPAGMERRIATAIEQIVPHADGTVLAEPG